MEYHITYEQLDMHWIVSEVEDGKSKIIIRCPSRDQAESFVEDRINWIGDGENNFENEA
tara:strand:+ start:6311 stop:6487 length:177 start_codon:yes stop_codon:yes gene_type:complete